MRRILTVVALLALAGCVGKTEYGECIGAFDDRDPALIYRVSTWNAVMGLVFVEVIIPPIYVLSEATLCPVRRRP